MKRARDLARSSRGFSLVEALVALLVIAIGMLGIAALYVESLRTNRTALFRTQAVTFVNDMADRIRANRLARAWYGSAVTAEDTNDACITGGAGCTPEELAQDDKARWLATLAAELPGGTGTVTWDPATLPETYTISVQWTETGQTDPLTLQMILQL